MLPLPQQDGGGRARPQAGFPGGPRRLTKAWSPQRSLQPHSTAEPEGPLGGQRMACIHSIDIYGGPNRLGCVGCLRHSYSSERWKNECVSFEIHCMSHEQ